MQLPCYADRLTSVLCSFSSLVIRNRHRVAMYFHAPCGVVLYVLFPKGSLIYEKAKNLQARKKVHKTKEKGKYRKREHSGNFN